MSKFSNRKVVFGYFGSWSIYRPGNGNFQIENIDPYMCTHLVYSFVGINSDGSIRILDQNAEIDKGGFRKFNALRYKNPSLKTLVAIGGWNEGSTTFSQVASKPHLRKAFVKNAVDFVKTYGFNGFDLDWEYPARRGGLPQDKLNFGLLVKEFREAFDQHGLLITAAVSATASSIAESYDVPTVSQYIHYINVMAYDFHTYSDGVTGMNAPLYPSSNDIGTAQKQLNVAASINAWIAAGANPQKLVMGLAAYGRSMTLADSRYDGIGVPVTGPGKQGQYTREPGNLGYNEICEYVQSGQWQSRWCSEQGVPYACSGNQWVGCDNPRSIALKVELGKRLNIGGFMIWSIDTDDFRGLCGQKYPLLNAINNAL